MPDHGASGLRSTPRGRLLVGTSGFSYPAWSPRFYPAGLRGDALLRHYAGVFPAVELNNTFYQQPTETKVAAWLEATPPDFRFSVKAQRSASLRSLAAPSGESLAWLTRPMTWFGERLGCVLLRVPATTGRDDERLAAALAAWPRSLPLVVEFQDPGWQVDETFEALARAGAVACATDLDGTEAPTIRLTGSFLYLRLRRESYDEAALAAWAERVLPFLEAGHDAFVFVRHDDVGRATETARRLRALVEERSVA